MDFITKIKNEYDVVRNKTLLSWAENPTVGKTKPITHIGNHFCLWCGVLYEPVGWIKDMYKELQEYSSRDIGCDLVLQNCLHFTFLVVVSARELDSKEFGDLENLSQIEEINLELFRNREMELRDVKLLSFNNALLLTAIPSEKTFILRKKYIEKILGTKWKPYLKYCYRNLELPPIFWHSTLLRYKFEFLPKELRELYFKYSNQKIKYMNLKPLKLLLTTYDLKIRYEINKTLNQSKFILKIH